MTILSRASNVVEFRVLRARVWKYAHIYSTMQAHGAF